MGFYIGDDSDDEMGLDEIIGQDEIIGADELNELFGADAPSKNMTLARKVALARAAGGVVTRRKVNTEFRDQPLPITPTTLASGTAADIELRPQRTFRLKRLVVSSVIAPYFNITNLTVGQDPQFVATGQIPATAFSEVAVGVGLRGSTANLGTTIVVSVLNIEVGGPNRTFAGMLVGDVVM